MQASLGPRNVQTWHGMEKYGRPGKNAGKQAKKQYTVYRCIQYTAVIRQSMTILYKCRGQWKCLVMPVRDLCGTVQASSDEKRPLKMETEA